MREVTIINGNEVVWINDIMYIHDELDGIGNTLSYDGWGEREKEV